MLSVVQQNQDDFDDVYQNQLNQQSQGRKIIKVIEDEEECQSQNNDSRNEEVNHEIQLQDDNELQESEIEEINENELEDDIESLDEGQNDQCQKKNGRKKKVPEQLSPDEYYYVDKLPKSLTILKKLREKSLMKLKQYRMKYFQDDFQNEDKKSFVPELAIPICADIRTFDFSKLRDEQISTTGSLFDVIMMDPPWQLSSSQPSRGVAIAYSQLADEIITKIPIETLQSNGYIFIWTINAKYSYTVKQITAWGYKIVDEIVWVKKTVNGRIAKGHGYYLQHAKEHCIIGFKGNLDENRFNKSVGSDVIFSERRGQSQKPEEIYQNIEKLCPQGFYLEIFGRRNNIRSNWVTIGNEI